MSDKIEILSFDELARFYGLSLMKWDEDNYASENTELAKDFFEAGQQSRQAEIDELTRELEIMKGWAKIAQANGEDKLKYLNIISEALCALESTPYWRRSGNCEIAIDILKKTSE